MTLVDSNVLIDVLASQQPWLERSANALDQRAALGPLYFNDIVYSELAVKSSSEAELDKALEDIGLSLIQIPKSAFYVAGKAFGEYRRAGGTRTSNLPDFFIGAHAQVEGLPLLTRDPQRYRIYFPKVELIMP